jgi:hypothetical protein
MPNYPNGEHAKTEDNSAARRERILRRARETLDRLELQAEEHERWRVDPQRLASASAAQAWVDEYNRRKLDGRA